MLLLMMLKGKRNSRAIIHIPWDVNDGSGIDVKGRRTFGVNMI